MNFGVTFRKFPEDPRCHSQQYSVNGAMGFNARAQGCGDALAQRDQYLGTKIQTEMNEPEAGSAVVIEETRQRLEKQLGVRGLNASWTESLNCPPQ